MFNNACRFLRFITLIVGTSTAELQAKGSHSNKKNGADNSKVQHAGVKSH